MILVSALYVITYTPLFTMSITRITLVYYRHYPCLLSASPLFIMAIRRNKSGEANPRDNALNVTLMISYFYSCANPFIYATKFDPVKRVLLSMIPCKKSSQPAESIGMA